MNEKLILITISGVQDFISKAKKTVDLYNGSHIIAETIKKIYENLCKNIKDFKLILPFKIDNDTDMPNYFIGKLNSEKDNSNLEEMIRNKLKKNIEMDIDLNVYIVVVDYNGNYKVAYKNLYEKLDCYKNDRFKDVSLKSKDDDKIETEVDKINCTVCGKRKGKYISTKTIFNDNKHTYDRSNLIREDEVLCQSCFRKREYLKSNYPSTIDVAVIEWREKIKEKDDQILKEYDKLVREKNKDVCIAECYRLDYVNKNIKESQELTTKLKNLNRLIDNKKPSRYYALIRADVDDLGKHFSGKYLNKNDELENFQRELSKKIFDFSKDVKQKLDKEFNEKLDIYLGGDDLLFFCPLYKVVEMIKYLNEKAKEIKIDNYDKDITLSKSVIIAHDSTPLKQVIKLSSTSLDNAKEKFKKEGKNALALSLINYSSTIRTSYLKCTYENINIIRNLINGFKNNISSSFITNLERQVSILGEIMSFEEYEVLMNVIKNEIKRIGKRKINKDKSINLIDDLQELLTEFIRRSRKNQFYINQKEYFNLLHIADKFSSEIIDNLKEGENA